MILFKQQHYWQHLWISLRSSIQPAHCLIQQIWSVLVQINGSVFHWNLWQQPYVHWTSQGQNHPAAATKHGSHDPRNTTAELREQAHDELRLAFSLNRKSQKHSLPVRSDFDLIKSKQSVDAARFNVLLCDGLDSILLHILQGNR